MSGVATPPVCLSESSTDALSSIPHMDEHEGRAARLRNLCRLSDPQWEKVGGVLPGRVGKLARSYNGKLFLEAVLWIADNQMSWTDVPKEFGDPHAIYIRFIRWTHDGVWLRVMDVLKEELPELNFRLSVLVYSYIEARALRRMRSIMKELTPGPSPAR